MTIHARVIGWPISQSKSPLIHGYWLQLYGIDGVYDKTAVEPDSLAKFVQDAWDCGMAGFNATMPHKEALMDLVDPDETAVAIGAINWLDMARIVRGQTISLKHREFVDAARLIGVSTPGIIRRHITPNLFGVVIVYLTLTIPQAILVESFLSFLGLGVQEPQTSLGALVRDGVGHMQTATWLLVIPAAVLALILFCFNFLGDGLRDIADPKKKT